MKKVFLWAVLLAAIVVFVFNGYKLYDYLTRSNMSREVNEELIAAAVRINPQF